MPGFRGAAGCGAADNGGMRWFRRRGQDEGVAEARPSFGTWLLEQFSGGEPVGGLPFARLERACSNAASLVCGAAYAEPGAFEQRQELWRPELRAEAGVVSRRTADGFRAALADRENTVLAWPWEHMGTSLAWQATRSGEVDAAQLGVRLEELAAAYALVHRAQLEAVIDLWRQVAAAVYRGEQEPDLPRMGSEMLAAYRATGTSDA